MIANAKAVAHGIRAMLYVSYRANRGTRNIPKR